MDLHWESFTLVNYFQRTCTVVPSDKIYIVFSLLQQTMGKVDILYLFTTYISMWALSSIKKVVIMGELCLMPQATCLVICINILSDLLRFACMAPMSGVKTVEYLYPYYWIWNTTHIHQSIIHIEKKCWSSLFWAIGRIVLHAKLYHWWHNNVSSKFTDLNCSGSPSVNAANMHVILSGQNFSPPVNSPESALMKLVSSQEPLLISSKLCSSLYCFIVSEAAVEVGSCPLPIPLLCTPTDVCILLYHSSQVEPYTCFHSNRNNKADMLSFFFVMDWAPKPAAMTQQWCSLYTFNKTKSLNLLSTLLLHI